MRSFNPISLIEEQYPELVEVRTRFVKRAVIEPTTATILTLAIGAAVGGAIGAWPYIKTWFYPSIERVRQTAGDEVSKTLRGLAAPLGGGLLGAGAGYFLTKNEQNRIRNAILGGLIGLGAGYALPYVTPFLTIQKSK